MLLPSAPPRNMWANAPSKLAVSTALSIRLSVSDVSTPVRRSRSGRTKRTASAPWDRLPALRPRSGPIGVSICADLRFPEVYRELALMGSEVTLCVSAFLAPRVDHWEFLLRARASENQTFLLASGQIGIEPKSGIGFVGRSMAVDPWGTIVATASDIETVLTTQIDLDYIAEVRRRWPLLEQRRPSLYRNIGRS